MTDTSLLHSDTAITRFITSSSWFSASNQRVKYNAFMPNPKIGRLETSVFRISEMNDVQIWQLGSRYLNLPVDRTLYGRADLTAGAVVGQNLAVESDDKPPRHANIVGWPLEKGAQQLIAKRLAHEATLRLMDSTQFQV